MNEILLKLQEANKKISKLERLVEGWQGEKKKLKERIDKMEKEMAAQKRAYEEMVEKYEAVKLSKSLAKPEDREAVQAKIDWYLNEIDTCLKFFGD